MRACKGLKIGSQSARAQSKSLQRKEYASKSSVKGGKIRLCSKKSAAVQTERGDCETHPPVMTSSGENDKEEIKVGSRSTFVKVPGSMVAEEASDAKQQTSNCFKSFFCLH